MADRTTDRGAQNAPIAGSATRPVTDLARGRRSEMPFLLVGWTAVLIAVVAALLVGAALLVWWLS